ncbi:hypothetical protein FOXYSP1_02107 [Fusarium oxysporum f. sp. phaseoli]
MPAYQDGVEYLTSDLDQHHHDSTKFYERSDKKSLKFTK